MIIQKEIELDALLELMDFPHSGLPEYSTDLVVQRRLGRLLTDASLHLVSNKIIAHR
jgi:hypothetical protein